MDNKNYSPVKGSDNVYAGTTVENMEVVISQKRENAFILFLIGILDAFSLYRAFVMLSLLAEVGFPITQLTFTWINIVLFLFAVIVFIIEHLKKKFRG